VSKQYPLLNFSFLKEPVVSMPLNSTGMYRGVIREDGQALTAIFDDDVLE